jgi:hypothetical protein
MLGQLSALCGRADGMSDSAERAAAEERKTAADQAFADKLAKRLPPDAVEHAAIEKARRRTKALPLSTL